MGLAIKDNIDLFPIRRRGLRYLVLFNICKYLAYRTLMSLNSLRIVYYSVVVNELRI